MSTVEELKHSRSLKIKKIEGLQKKIQENITKGTERLVDKYYNELQALYAEFEDEHIRYLIKAKLTFEDEAEAGVFQGVSDIMDTMQGKYDMFTILLEEQAQHAEDTAKAKKLADEKKLQQNQRKNTFLYEFDSLLKSAADLKELVEKDESGADCRALENEVYYFDKKADKALELT